MPLYEFICQNCGYEFEKVVSFSATHSPTCPSCESNQVERQMGVPAIHFKGSGWYVNDSKKSEKSETKASEEGTNKTADVESSESKEVDGKKKESKSESKKEVAKPAAKED